MDIVVRLTEFAFEVCSILRISSLRHLEQVQYFDFVASHVRSNIVTLSLTVYLPADPNDRPFYVIGAPNKSKSIQAKIGTKKSLFEFLHSRILFLYYRPETAFGNVDRDRIVPIRDNFSDILDRASVNTSTVTFNSVDLNNLDLDRLIPTGLTWVDIHSCSPIVPESLFIPWFKRLLSANRLRTLDITDTSSTVPLGLEDDIIRFYLENYNFNSVQSKSTTDKANFFAADKVFLEKLADAWMNYDHMGKQSCLLISDAPNWNVSSLDKFRQVVYDNGTGGYERNEKRNGNYMNIKATRNFREITFSVNWN